MGFTTLFVGGGLGFAAQCTSNAIQKIPISRRECIGLFSLGWNQSTWRDVTLRYVWCRCCSFHSSILLSHNDSFLWFCRTLFCYLRTAKINSILIVILFYFGWCYRRAMDARTLYAGWRMGRPDMDQRKVLHVGRRERASCLQGSSANGRNGSLFSVRSANRRSKRGIM